VLRLNVGVISVRLLEGKVSSGLSVRTQDINRGKVNSSNESAGYLFGNRGD